MMGMNPNMMNNGMMGNMNGMSPNMMNDGMLGNMNGMSPNMMNDGMFGNMNAMNPNMMLNNGMMGTMGNMGKMGMMNLNMMNMMNMGGMPGVNMGMNMGGMPGMNMGGMPGMANMNNVSMDDAGGWNLVFENQNDRQSYPVTISEQKTIKEAISMYRVKSGNNDPCKFIVNSKELYPEMRICESGLNNNSRILVISTRNLKGAF